MSNILEHNILAARRDKASKQMSSAKRWIWVTFSKVGLHHYPAANNDPTLKDVAYLGSPHRHKFGFKVQIQIFHNDRELEFHQFLNFCESIFGHDIIDINHKSVEMLADDLYAQIVVNYPGRDVIINVDEDGENGCCIEYSNQDSKVTH